MENNLNAKDLYIINDLLEAEIKTCESNIKNIEDSQNEEVRDLKYALQYRIIMLEKVKTKIKGMKETCSN